MFCNTCFSLCSSLFSLSLLALVACIPPTRTRHSAKRLLLSICLSVEQASSLFLSAHQVTENERSEEDKKAGRKGFLRNAFWAAKCAKARNLPEEEREWLQIASKMRASNAGEEKVLEEVRELMKANGYE